MNNILIYTDPYKGTIIPTFSLAERLAKQGFNIHYIGVADAMIEAKKANYQSHVVFEKQFPLKSKYSAGKVDHEVVRLMLNGELDGLIQDLAPQLIIVTAHNPVEALIFYYKYKIEIALFFAHFPIAADFTLFGSYTTKVKSWCEGMLIDDSNTLATDLFIEFLYGQGYHFKGLEDLLSVFNNFKNLLAFSKEMLVEDASSGREDIYLGACLCDYQVFTDDESDSRLMSLLAPSPNKLVYCCLGTWADEINSSKANMVFNLLIKLFKRTDFGSYTLLLIAGNLFERYKHHESSNIIVRKWGNQRHLLMHSKLAIIHGGMGSIKECIVNEVPMIVTPLGIDQFENAKRVSYHGWGVELSTEELNEATLAKKIKEVLDGKISHDHFSNINAAFVRDAKDDIWIGDIGYEI